MWPLFGLVTFIVASIYVGRLRWSARWKGWMAREWLPSPTFPASSRATVEPIPYRVAYSGTKRGPRVEQIGVSTECPLDFECKPETWVDRFFKWTGLAVEQALGQDRFDRAIYLVGDDPRVIDAIRADPRVSAILMSFFADGPHPDYQSLRLVCRRGSLRLDVRERSLLPARVLQMHDRVIPALRELGDRLPARLPPASRTQHWLSLRAVVVLALSSGLAINGVVQLFRLLAFSGAQTLEPGGLLAYGVPVGAALLGMLVLVAVGLLARSSRLHLVMLELLLVGGFGAFSTGITGVRDVNMALDSSVATTSTATVLDKRSSRSRRGGRRYYLELSPAPIPGKREVRVGAGVYDAVGTGDQVELRLRQGWLHIAWLEQIEKARKR